LSVGDLLVKVHKQITNRQEHQTIVQLWAELLVVILKIYVINKLFHKMSYYLKNIQWTPAF